MNQVRHYFTLAGTVLFAIAAGNVLVEGLLAGAFRGRRGAVLLSTQQPFVFALAALLLLLFCLGLAYLAWRLWQQGPEASAPKARPAPAAAAARSAVATPGAGPASATPAARPAPGRWHRPTLFGGICVLVAGGMAARWLRPGVLQGTGLEGVMVLALGVALLFVGLLVLAVSPYRPVAWAARVLLALLFVANLLGR